MGTNGRLLVSSIVAALALTALSAPVAALDTKGTLAIVNGIPGRIVDVCINGNELRSNLGYGRVFTKDVVNPGNKNLRVYERDPRTCRGNMLAQESFLLDPGEDLTIVATKMSPKVVIFDNAGLGEIPPDGAPIGMGVIAWRHAAEIDANFRYSAVVQTPEVPVAPAADPVWTKGDTISGSLGPGAILRLRATKPEQSRTIAVKQAEMRSNRRHEWILVGSKVRNLLFVYFERRISQPSP
jgi:hypothetical protein